MGAFDAGLDKIFGPQPKKTADDPSKGAPLQRRIAPLQRSVDVGEQIAGSDNAFELGTVQVLDGFRGHGSVFAQVAPQPMQTDGLEQDASPLAPGALAATLAQAFSIETGPNFTPLQIEADVARPLRIRFHPTVSGQHSAQVVIRIIWSDGGRSEEIISVAGRARWPTDVPAHNQVDSSKPPSFGPSGGADAPKTSDTSEGNPVDLATAAELARDKVGGVIDAQRDGINLAEKESLSFTEEVPPAAWWAPLVEIALSMGVAAVATVVAKSIAKKVVGLHIKDPAALKESKIFLGLSDGVKDGLKAVGKKAIPAIGAKGHPKTPGPAVGTGTFSSNPALDFWEAQRSKLRGIAEHQKREIRDTEARLRTKDPEMAAQTMTAIAGGLEDTGNGNEVELAQAFASETQWMTGIAQSTLGRDPVEGERKSETEATDMLHVRADTQFGKHNGVLHVDVDLPAHDVAGAKVRGASIMGVAQEIADRVWQYPLVHAAMPILVVVHSGSHVARITRDEAGRVRVDGELMLSEDDAAASEAQSIRGATELLEVVMSRSMADWGVAEIKTDDATRRGS